MDSKTFAARISKKLGCEPKTANTMIGALSNIIKERAAELDSIAIPGFGNFVAMKKPESVQLSENGQRMLVPPMICVEFVPGSKLRRSMIHE